MGQMVAFHLHHIFHDKCALSGKKNARYLSVNVFSRKVVGDTIFTPPREDGTTILKRGHPSHAKVYRFAVQRQNLSFSVSFKTLSIGPAPGIEPATSRSAVKRSTDWANPAAVKMVPWNIKTFYFFLFLLLFLLYYEYTMW